MLRICTFLLAASTLFGCRDEFIDPNPDSNYIVDNEAPLITLINLKQDSIHRGIDTLPIRIDYWDNYQLAGVNFNLVATNVIIPGMNFTYQTDSKSWSLDTFMPLPAVDTLNLSLTNVCQDLAENISTKSIQFQVIR